MAKINKKVMKKIFKAEDNGIWDIYCNLHTYQCIFIATPEAKMKGYGDGYTAHILEVVNIVPDLNCITADGRKILNNL